MSQNKDKILKLLANTKIAGHYRPILNRYSENPEYAKLAYHNTDHVVSVLNLFEVLRKLSGQSFSKDELSAAYPALALHDIMHSGKPDFMTDEDNLGNIQRAVNFATQWGLDNHLKPTVLADTLEYIEATEYPNRTPVARRYNSNVNPALIAMIRDADMLWGWMPGNAVLGMMRVGGERRNVGLEENQLDIMKTLTNQIVFIQKYEPLSGPGRTFKNAMFEDGCTAWSLVALEYQRQVMAAEMVSELSDEQILHLAASMKSGQTLQHVESVEQPIAGQPSLATAAVADAAAEVVQGTVGTE